MSLDEHKNLDDAQLHNPKGFAGAANNTAPTKDNAGALVWQVGGVQGVQVTITNVDLNTTPKELIAAAGAGTYIEVLSVVGKLDYQTTAISGTTTGLEIRYTNYAGNYTGIRLSKGWIEAVADTVEITNSGYNQEATTPEENAPVVATTGSDGSGDSQMILNITYRILTL